MKGRISASSLLPWILTIVAGIALVLPPLAGQVNVITFDGLAPTTTRGDLIYRNATTNTRLAAGTSGQFLKTLGSGADPVFAAVPAFTVASTSGATAGHSPAASTTYFFGNNYFGANPAVTSAGAGRTIIPTACTLRSVYFNAQDLATAASAQNVQIFVRVNNTTDVTISTTAQWTTVGDNISSTSALSTALAAGDYIQIKIITPAWGTLPTPVFYSAILYCDVP